MTIPTKVRQKAEELLNTYCEDKVPMEIRDKVKLGFRILGNTITLFEIRPHYSQKKKLIESPVAKIKYLQNADKWQL